MSFTSKFLPDVNQVELGDTPKLMRETIRSPYTRTEHEIVIGTVKPALMGERIVDAAPTYTLNALWDGVVRGTGCVNELAAVTSIANYHESNRS